MWRPIRWVSSLRAALIASGLLASGIASGIGVPAVAHGQELFAQSPPQPALRQAAGWRLGLIGSGLVDSGQGRPFTYLDAGLRYKTDDYYVDLKLPALVAMLDFLQYSLQEGLVGVVSPFNLFEALNEPTHYGAYLEALHLRLGQSFTIFAFGGPNAEGEAAPLRLSVGLAALAEFVFFDRARFDVEEPEDLENPNALDPIVAGAGGFIALGGDAPSSSYDVALGVVPDLYQDDAYVPADGLVLFADLEVMIDVADDVGVYLRWRASTYTHDADVFIATIVAGCGVVLRLY